MIQWLRRLLAYRHKPIHVMQLREPNGMLANYILNTLRRWHWQNGHGYDMLILKSEDIEALAEWAAELQKSHEKTVWWAPFWKMRVKELPQPIYHNHQPQ